MNFGDVKAILKELDLRPGKALGQNFLTDEATAKWICDQIDPESADAVIEIGPGLGALTRHLVHRCKKLYLIEFDHRIATWLRMLALDFPHVEVIEADACKIDHRRFFQEGEVRLIGNLPYSCGGEIIRHWIVNSPTPVKQAVFMLQKEVCQRLTADAGDEHYGMLSLRVQHQWRAEYLKEVPPDVFVPRPNVDSAVIRLHPIPADELPIYDRRFFDELLRRGFHERRKQLYKFLPQHPQGKSWETLAQELNLSPKARAEELGLAHWIELTRQLDPHPLSDQGQSPDESFDVVNEEDEVIGQAPRAQVHAEGLIHRAVHLFIFNKKGELFLQKRSHLKDVHPLTWDSSAAGHVDAGEEPLQAAKRELREELGLNKAVDLELVEKISPQPATGMEFVSLYQGQLSGSAAQFRLPPEEIATGGFFALDQIDAWMAQRPQDFADGFIICYQTWKNLRGEELPVSKTELS